MAEQEVLLGTVAIEPARWKRGPDAPAPIVLSAWLDAIAEAGFDGIEVWEPHLARATPTEAEAVLSHELPVTVFNSYVSLDDPDPNGTTTVADWARRAGSTGIKFNVGNEPGAAHAYAERIAAWTDELPDHVTLLCECHHGISIAEDPQVASQIFDAAGPVGRLQAIVHTHEEADHLRARFDAYGDRISHVHVNFLDFDTLSAPRLRDFAERLEAKVQLLRTLGFAGSWTLEFVHGLLTDADHPEALVEQATDDLIVLRQVLA